jgi:cytochrome P450
VLTAVDSDLTNDWAVTSFTPWDGRLNHRNIWGLYRQIRDQAPAVRSAAHEGLWLIGRHRDVRSAAQDYKAFSSASSMLIGFEAPSDPRGAPIEYDPPEHTRLRAAMAGPFRPTRIGRFEPMVTGHVDQLLAAVATKGECDIVRDIAEPLAVSVVSDIIGFEPSQRDRNRALALAFISATFDGLAAARAPYREFIRRQVDEAFTRPGPGMLRELVRLSDGGRAFAPEEVCNIVYALALAGHHTTIYGISAMLLRAAEADVRDRWLRDLGDPTVIRSFVDETLRIDPPIHLEARRTTRDVDVGGVGVPAGAQVALLFGSANHDERVFEDPESFRPGRVGKSLAFGHGIHMCLGVELARLEMSSVLRAVLHRFDEVALLGAPVDSGMVFGHLMGWDSIPARFR